MTTPKELREKFDKILNSHGKPTLRDMGEMFDRYEQATRDQDNSSAKLIAQDVITLLDETPMPNFEVAQLKGLPADQLKIRRAQTK